MNNQLKNNITCHSIENWTKFKPYSRLFTYPFVHKLECFWSGREEEILLLTGSKVHLLETKQLLHGSILDIRRDIGQHGDSPTHLPSVCHLDLVANIPHFLQTHPQGILSEVILGPLASELGITQPSSKLVHRCPSVELVGPARRCPHAHVEERDLVHVVCGVHSVRESS